MNLGIGIVVASTFSSRERIPTRVSAAEDVHDWAGNFYFERFRNTTFKWANDSCEESWSNGVRGHLHGTPVRQKESHARFACDPTTVPSTSILSITSLPLTLEDFKIRLTLHHLWGRETFQDIPLLNIKLTKNSRITFAGCYFPTSAASCTLCTLGSLLSPEPDGYFGYLQPWCHLL